MPFLKLRHQSTFPCPWATGAQRQVARGASADLKVLRDVTTVVANVFGFRNHAESNWSETLVHFDHFTEFGMRSLSPSVQFNY